MKLTAYSCICWLFHRMLFSFFLSYFEILIPARCRCRALLLHLITLNDIHTHHKHTHTHTHTLGRTPLGKGSACRRELYLTTNNIYERQTSMFLAGFELTVPASDRPQTHALDRAVTGISVLLIFKYKNEDDINYSKYFTTNIKCI